MKLPALPSRLLFLLRRLTMPRYLVAVACCVAWPAAALAQETDLQPPDRAIAKIVDHYIDQTLAQNKLRAAPRADDATLIRRLTLDLNGRIPTLSECSDYLADGAADKKAKLVDRLLSSPAFVRHQAQ